MNDLLNKLKATGLIKKGFEKNEENSRSNRYLENYFQGNWVVLNSGNVFHIHEAFPYEHKYGKITFTKEINSSRINSFENIPENINIFNNIVFVDIETSNLSLGAGSFVFLVGICYFTNKGIETDIFLIDRPGYEKALLEKLSLELSRFNIISSYNGKSFDIPFLRNRFAIYQLDNTLNTKYHIDLLLYARRIWKLSINSCKLSDIERKILQFFREEEEIPGWLVPQAYFDYLRNKDPELLKGIIYHNKIDVISLAALFQHISFLLSDSGEYQIYDKKEYFSLAKLYGNEDAIELAKYFYKLGFENNSDSDFTARFYWEFGMLLKKNNEIENALSYWEQSGNAGFFASCIELSKYFEHKVKNYQEALIWAKKAENISSHNKMSNNKLTENQLQIDHRIERIKRKISNYEK